MMAKNRVNNGGNDEELMWHGGGANLVVGVLKGGGNGGVLSTQVKGGDSGKGIWGGDEDHGDSGWRWCVAAVSSVSNAQFLCRRGQLWINASTTG
ncbi:hypothetical protein Tco_0856068 [Tanacetum coccineum]